MLQEKRKTKEVFLKNVMGVMTDDMQAPSSGVTDEGA